MHVKVIKKKVVKFTEFPYLHTANRKTDRTIKNKGKRDEKKIRARLADKAYI